MYMPPKKMCIKFSLLVPEKYPNKIRIFKYHIEIAKNVT